MTLHQCQRIGTAGFVIISVQMIQLSQTYSRRCHADLRSTARSRGFHGIHRSVQPVVHPASMAASMSKVEVEEEAMRVFAEASAQDLELMRDIVRSDFGDAVF